MNSKKNHQLKMFGLLILTVGLLSGCSLVFKEAITITPTPEIYQLPDRQPPVVLVWDDYPVESICLDVMLDFPEKDGEIPDSMETYIRRLFEVMGISIRLPAFNCDATMIVDVTGKALSAFYMPGGRLYTGKDLRGTVTLKAQGMPDQVLDIEYRKSPPATVSLLGSGPTKKTDVNFSKHWWPELNNFMADLWGPRARIWSSSQGISHRFFDTLHSIIDDPVIRNDLIYALNNDADDVRYSACKGILHSIELSENIKNYEEFIPALLNLIEIGGEKEQECAGEIIAMIAGKDPDSMDVDNWKDWWSRKQKAAAPDLRSRIEYYVIPITFSVSVLSALYGLLVFITGKLILFKARLPKKKARNFALMLIAPQVILIVLRSLSDRFFRDYVLLGVPLLFNVLAIRYLLRVNKKGEKDGDTN